MVANPNTRIILKLLDKEDIAYASIVGAKSRETRKSITLRTQKFDI